MLEPGPVTLENNAGQAGESLEQPTPCHAGFSEDEGVETGMFKRRDESKPKLFDVE